MDTQIIKDTVALVQHTYSSLNQAPTAVLILNIVYKIAMILIAGFNIVFAVFIFVNKNKKEEDSNEKNRKIGLLKSLVLDYNMKYLYEFFDNIDVETFKLRQPGLTDEDKKQINDKLIDFGKILRQKFIDTLIAIDKNLYNEFLKSIDDLLDNFTNNIFDGGINLIHIPKFEEKIINSIFETKTSVIKLLFNYKGE